MRTNSLPGLALAVMVVAAACGGGTTTSPRPTAAAVGATATAAAGATATAAAGATATAAAGATATAAAGATATAAAGEATVQLAETDLGTILVDGEGLTLYGFVPDEESGQPTCYEQCAAAWPPFLVEGEFTVGDGLDTAAFSTVERTDSGTQLRIGTHPLYYFASDAGPGETKGQSLSDAWFVVGADGELIRGE